MKSIIAAGLALVLPSMAIAAPKPHLLDATPTANAAVTAPRVVVLHFSTPLDPKTSGAGLMKADGSMAPAKSAVSPADPKTLEVTPQSALSAGAYMVMWTAAAPGAPPISGDYSFNVQ
jgi:methionine-rich copper-binding protein CopC